MVKLTPYINNFAKSIIYMVDERPNKNPGDEPEKDLSNRAEKLPLLDSTGDIPEEQLKDLIEHIKSFGVDPDNPTDESVERLLQTSVLIDNPTQKEVAQAKETVRNLAKRLVDKKAPEQPLQSALEEVRKRRLDVAGKQGQALDELAEEIDKSPTVTEERRRGTEAATGEALDELAEQARGLRVETEAAAEVAAEQEPPHGLSLVEALNDLERRIDEGENEDEVAEAKAELEKLKEGLGGKKVYHFVGEGENRVRQQLVLGNIRKEGEEWLATLYYITKKGEKRAARKNPFKIGSTRFKHFKRYKPEEKKEDEVGFIRDDNGNYKKGTVEESSGGKYDLKREDGTVIETLSADEIVRYEEGNKAVYAKAFVPPQPRRSKAAGSKPPGKGGDDIESEVEVGDEARDNLAENAARDVIEGAGREDEERTDQEGGREAEDAATRTEEPETEDAEDEEGEEPEIFTDTSGPRREMSSEEADVRFFLGKGLMEGSVKEYEEILAKRERYKRLLESANKANNKKEQKKCRKEIDNCEWQLDEYNRKARWAKEDYIGSKEYYRDEKSTLEARLKNAVEDEDQDAADELRVELDSLEKEANPSFWRKVITPKRWLNIPGVKQVAQGAKWLSRRAPVAAPIAFGAAGALVAGPFGLAVAVPVAVAAAVPGAAYGGREMYNRDQNGEKRIVGPVWFNKAVNYLFGEEQGGNGNSSTTGRGRNSELTKSNSGINLRPVDSGIRLDADSGTPDEEPENPASRRAKRKTASAGPFSNGATSARRKVKGGAASGETNGEAEPQAEKEKKLAQRYIAEVDKAIEECQGNILLLNGAESGNAQPLLEYFHLEEARLLEAQVLARKIIEETWDDELTTQEEFIQMMKEEMVLLPSLVKGYKTKYEKWRTEEGEEPVPAPAGLGEGSPPPTESEVDPLPDDVTTLSFDELKNYLDLDPDANLMQMRYVLLEGKASASSTNKKAQKFGEFCVKVLTDRLRVDLASTQLEEEVEQTLELAADRKNPVEIITALLDLNPSAPGFEGQMATALRLAAGGETIAEIEANLLALDPFTRFGVQIKEVLRMEEAGKPPAEIEADILALDPASPLKGKVKKVLKLAKDKKEAAEIAELCGVESPAAHKERVDEVMRVMQLVMGGKNIEEIREALPDSIKPKARPASHSGKKKERGKKKSP